jgi:hypothetical protein
MKWPRCFLDKTRFAVLGLLLLLTFMAVAVKAEDKRPDDLLLDARYSMAGLRLGFWADMSDTKPIQDYSIEADLPNAGFYTEIYLDYRLVKPLFLEMSMGIASRGDVVIHYAGDSYIGTIILYPILMQLKFSPLEGRTRSFHPFVLAGGGFVWGRQSIDIISFGSSSSYYNPDIVAKTETDFIGVVGGGLDLALSEQLGLTAAAKYQPIKFVNNLAGVREYTGMSISVGVSYYLHKK